MSYHVSAVREGGAFSLYEGEDVSSRAGGRAVDGYSLVRKEKDVPRVNPLAPQKAPWFGREEAPIVLAVADEDWHWSNQKQKPEKDQGDGCFLGHRYDGIRAGVHVDLFGGPGAHIDLVGKPCDSKKEDE